MSTDKLPYAQAVISSASGGGISAVGVYSTETRNLQRSPQTHVTVCPVTPISAGTITIRARAAGRKGFSKINLEGIVLAATDSWSWIIPGFWGAWQVEVTHAITGSFELNLAATTEPML